MKDFVVTIARALAEYPDQIRASEIGGAHTAIVEVRCDPRDRGRLIGKSGRTINAIQTLMSNLAARQNRRAILEVVE